MKTKKSSRFKLPFNASSSSSSSSITSSSSSALTSPVTSSVIHSLYDEDKDVRLLSVRRKSLTDDSGWESTTPSISSSTSSSKSFTKSNFFKLFHRSAATLLLHNDNDYYPLPQKQQQHQKQQRYYRPFRNNVFIKNQELNLELLNIHDDDKQTSFVTKARRRRRSSNDHHRMMIKSLSVANLHKDYFSTLSCSTLTSTSSSAASSTSSSPRHATSVNSIISATKDDSNYDSGAYSRTSSPDQDIYEVDIEKQRALAIAAPLSAPSLVLAACMDLKRQRRYQINDLVESRVSVTISADTKLAISSVVNDDDDDDTHSSHVSKRSRSGLPVLGTAGLSPNKMITARKASRPRISTVYLNHKVEEQQQQQEKEEVTTGCECSVTVNGQHHCFCNYRKQFFSDVDGDSQPNSFIQI